MSFDIFIVFQICLISVIYMGVGGLFVGDKVAGAWSQFHVVLRQGMLGVALPLHYVLQYSLANL